MTKRKKWAILISIFAVLLLAGIVSGVMLNRSAPEQKMIVRWDFSRGFGSFQQDAYIMDSEVTEFAIDPVGGRDGRDCAVIRNKGDNDSRLVYSVDARANTYYRISAWIRSEGVDTGAGAVGANLSVMDLLEYGGGVNLTGDSQWTHVEFYGKTGKSQKSFQVALRLGFYGGDIRGTAYFDDVEIEQLSSLPDGAAAISLQASSHNGGGNTSKLPFTYRDAMRVSFLLLLGVFLLFVLGYRYARIRDREWNLSGKRLSERGLSVQTGVWMILFVGLVIRLILSVTAPQCDIDVNLFKHWANQSASLGMSNTYPNAETLNLDYPPLHMYYLFFIGNLVKGLGLAASPVFTLLIKLPAILADCAIGYLLYRLCDKRMSKNWTFLAVMLWVFNPVAILDSAAWGQVDSILAFYLLAMLYFVMKEKFVPASAMLALSVLLKPQGIILSPILFFALVKYLIREKNAKALLPFAYSLGTFLGVFLLGLLPFWSKMPLSWPVDLYLGTAGGYEYASVNALNFWFLIGANWVKDSQPFWGLSYFWWGMIFIVLSSVATWILYQKSKRMNYIPYLLASVLLYSVVTFGPRMHERYFFPIVAFLLAAVLYSNNKWLLWLYSAISVCGFLTVMEIMIDLLLGDNWPGLASTEGSMTTFRWLLCACNVITCLLLLIFAVLAAAGKMTPNDPSMKIWDLHEEEPKELTLLEDTVDTV